MKKAITLILVLMLASAFLLVGCGNGESGTPGTDNTPPHGPVDSGTGDGVLTVESLTGMWDMIRDFRPNPETTTHHEDGTVDEWGELIYTEASADWAGILNFQENGPIWWGGDNGMAFGSSWSLDVDAGTIEAYPMDTWYFTYDGEELTIRSIQSTNDSYQAFVRNTGGAEETDEDE